MTKYQEFFWAMNGTRSIKYFIDSFSDTVINNWDKVRFRGEVCIPDARCNSAVESKTFDTFQEVFQWLGLLGSVGERYRIYLVGDFRYIEDVDIGRRLQLADITELYENSKR